jgi:RND family efflux transporter MFP subunit
MQQRITHPRRCARLAVGLLAPTAFLASPAAQALEVPFPTTPVVYEITPRERIWDGRVEAVNQATVSAQTSGRVAEISYDVDDFVETGAVIMRFTDTEQRAALRQTEAAFEEAEARLAEADNEYERISRLYESDAVPKSRYDQAVASFNSARARVEAARSGVAAAEEQLEYTVVRAPYAGIVSERHVEVGEMVSPGQPLMSGLSLQSLRVNVDVPQSMVDPIREIGTAYVYVGDARIPGEYLTFFPIADPLTNTFRIRVHLPDASATLYPGMFVKVGFVIGEARRLLIPAESVVRRSELTAVYVVGDDRVSLRQIRAGRRYGERVEVLAGLAEGELVATDPVRAGVFLKERAGAARDSDG